MKGGTQIFEEFIKIAGSRKDFDFWLIFSHFRGLLYSKNLKKSGKIRNPYRSRQKTAYICMKSSESARKAAKKAPQNVMK